MFSVNIYFFDLFLSIFCFLLLLLKTVKAQLVFDQREELRNAEVNDIEDTRLTEGLIIFIGARKLIFKR